MGWSCPELPHVALSLECGGLNCSGWEVRRRCGAAERVSFPSSTRGLASPLRFQRLCQLLLLPFLFFSPPQLLEYMFCFCLQLSVFYTVVWGIPNNYDIVWEAGHGGPHRMHYA